MIIESKRKILDDICAESLVYDNPSFDNSIIGISTDGNVIYSLSKMVQEFAKDNDCSEEDSLEFIEYNTLNARISGGVLPIVMDDMFDYFE